MKKVLIVILAVVMSGGSILIACSSSGSKKECGSYCCSARVKGDSLMALWDSAWNSHNLEMLKNMITDGALAIGKNWELRTKDTLVEKWFKPNLPDVISLKTEPIKESNRGCCIAMTGYYSIDVNTSKGVVSGKGNYTFVWNEQKDQSWKLEVMHLTETTE